MISKYKNDFKILTGVHKLFGCINVEQKVKTLYCFFVDEINFNAVFAE